jgi:hypothetical protein
VYGWVFCAKNWQLHRFFSHTSSFGKAPHFGKTPGDKAAGNHAEGRAKLARARIAPLAGQQHHCPPRDVQRLPKVPHGTVCQAQVGLGEDLDIERTAGGGQGEGTLASRYGAVILAHSHEIEAQMAGNLSKALVIAQPLDEGLGGA